MIKGSYRFLKTFFQPISWLQLVFGGSAVTAAGTISTYLAQRTSWITEKGPFAIFLAASLGIVLAASIFALFFWARYLFVLAKAADFWAQQTELVDPLAAEYQKRRINLAALSHPATRMIERKRFVDCQLVGPANLFGQGSTAFVNVRFTRCDWVVVHPSAYVQNAFGLSEVEVIGGEIIDCTIFVTEGNLPSLKNAPPNIVTYTGPRSA